MKKINVSGLKKQVGDSITFAFTTFTAEWVLNSDVQWVNGDILIKG